MKHLTFKNVCSALAVWISFVFLQSGFFKFSGAEETVHIFSTVGNWMAANIHPDVGIVMVRHGGYIIGTLEVIASVLLLIPVFYHIFGKSCSCNKKLSFLGALITFGTMTGAIFFHLFTPLGINVLDDGGTLFGMAVSVWLSSLVLMYKNKSVVLG